MFRTQVRYFASEIDLFLSVPVKCARFSFDLVFIEAVSEEESFPYREGGAGEVGVTNS